MKLFVEEQHSQAMRERGSASGGLLVSQLTWAEMCAGLARKQRMGEVEAQITAKALEELRDQWPRYGKLPVNEQLINSAGELALRFGLRAYDSVQLASAHQAQLQLGDRLLFCCFDKQLNAAANALAMATLEA